MGEAEGLRVWILARPHFDVAHAEFLHARGLEWTVSSDATDAERLIEFAGRLCYMSFGRNQYTIGTSRYIRHLIAQGHESVIEHAVWSFLLTGISRSFSHQLVRHRVGFSFSQLSQQYHDEHGFELVLPPDIDGIPGARSAIETTAEAARKAYAALIALASEADHLSEVGRRERLRAHRSLARSVLPNATETKLVVTANARALRHFFRLRGTIEGDLEMRLVAAELLAAIAPDAPSVFSDFDCVTNPADGYPILRFVSDGEQ